MLALAETLLKKINQLMSLSNPNCGDYEALEAFYNSTRQLIIDLSGYPNYFERDTTCMHGLGSSREQ